MTTIAYKDGVLAADTLTTCSGQFAGFDVKIHRERGVLIGGAGSAAAYEQFRDWVRGGMKGECPLRKDIGNMFVVSPDGHAVMWCDDGPFKLTTDMWALGSGERYAIGAMEMGASPEQAVRIASKWDRSTGGDVTVLRFRSAEIIPLRVK